MASPPPQAIFRKLGNHVTRTIAGETIVVPIRAQAAELDSVYVFNQVGASIWALLDSARGADEIAQLIADEFDVSPEAAHADVMRFLETLRGAGLVEGQVAR